MNDENTASRYQCKKCHDYFNFKPDEVRWIEFGSYSEKTITCPHCGCVNVIKYVDGFNQNPNFDERYYM